MDNPPRNLLHARMVEELRSLAHEVDEEAGIRALVRTGSAEGIFITHNDVGELSVASDRLREQDAPAGNLELHGIHNADRATIQ